MAQRIRWFGEREREREERNGLGNVKVRHILLSAIFILRTVRKTSKGSFNYLN